MHIPSEKNRMIPSYPTETTEFVNEHCQKARAKVRKCFGRSKEETAESSKGKNVKAGKEQIRSRLVDKNRHDSYDTMLILTEYMSISRRQLECESFVDFLPLILQGRIVKREKEKKRDIRAGLCVMSSSAKVTYMVRDMCLVRTEKELN
ncbi:hypothetical protein CDAR_480741 [Caerostris darwini]|uniref:Uncharacterized protein n=1 Tax=Caerostris darwini TaxID=1538125 RepID=A0AAV4S2N0_9ARAC|nr:hypothetical protein CDAR_480741 [Caerostris darwini]